MSESASRASPRRDADGRLPGQRHERHRAFEARRLEQDQPGLMGWGTRHTMVGATSCAEGFVAAACAADSIAIAAGCVRRCLRVFF